MIITKIHFPFTFTFMIIPLLYPWLLDFDSLLQQLLPKSQKYLLVIIERVFSMRYE